MKRSVVVHSYISVPATAELEGLRVRGHPSLFIFKVSTASIENKHIHSWQAAQMKILQ